MIVSKIDDKLWKIEEGGGSIAFVVINAETEGEAVKRAKICFKKQRQCLLDSMKPYKGASQ